MTFHGPACRHTWTHRGKRLDTAKVSQRCAFSTRSILHPFKLPPRVFGFCSACLCNLSVRNSTGGVWVRKHGYATFPELCLKCLNFLLTSWELKLDRWTSPCNLASVICYNFNCLRAKVDDCKSITSKNCPVTLTLKFTLPAPSLTCRAAD